MGIEQYTDSALALLFEERYRVRQYGYDPHIRWYSRDKEDWELFNGDQLGLIRDFCGWVTSELKLGNDLTYSQEERTILRLGSMATHKKIAAFVSWWQKADEEEGMKILKAVQRDSILALFSGGEIDGDKFTWYQQPTGKEYHHLMYDNKDTGYCITKEEGGYKLHWNSGSLGKGMHWPDELFAELDEAKETAIWRLKYKAGVTDQPPKKPERRRPDLRVVNGGADEQI